ncbi:hypothetical protein ACJ73_06922 [Blastomyces percursus]|uniref:CCHC-type domain-containing protein n=1 Tax=Blastomyces percursus TaxID=1658174 RepID=A0A1J9PZI2_9EURO|nr:hypothetical protein ACJ73_06922 [Blastomyces percursus]
MLKKALSLELLRALVTVDEAVTYEGFCTQLRRLDDRLTKLKSIQAGSGRRFTPATNAPPPQKDPDTMEWVSSNATRPSFRVPGISYEDAADRRQRGVCINCDRPGHIAAHCRSDFVPARKKIRANYITVEGGGGKEESGRPRRSSEAGKRLAPAKIRRQELEEVGRQRFEEKMKMNAILVPTTINNMYNMKAMVDSGLCHYSMIRSSVVRRLNLQRTPLPSPRPLTGFDGPRDARTHYMVKLDIDVGGQALKMTKLFKPVSFL